MEIRNTQWRKQAKEIGQNASILAGGDGSRKARNGETQLRHMGGDEFMESENTRWNTEKTSSTQMSESWLPEGTWTEYARSNTRAEQTHILAAMIQ
jgi:hypothetical protein